MNQKHMGKVYLETRDMAKCVLGFQPPKISERYCQTMTDLNLHCDPPQEFHVSYLASSPFLSVYHLYSSGFDGDLLNKYDV